MSQFTLTALGLYGLVFTLGATTSVLAVDDDLRMMRAATLGAGRMSDTEKQLYEDSIRSAKQSMIRENLDYFYRDAVDYYRKGRYDEAMELLNKIYGLDPNFENVRSLRETILRLKTGKESAAKKDSLDALMRKGNDAIANGQLSLAISHWKQALTVDPGYAPAKKRIEQANAALAKKEFEQGYLHYHGGRMEEALENWSNAIALDPSYKKKGLLPLMTKIELGLKKERIENLRVQAQEQLGEKDYLAGIQSYEAILELDPRHEEARRMIGKIKLQLGLNAYQAANTASKQGLYAEAIKQWQTSIEYGYEVQRSKKFIEDTEVAMRRPRTVSRPRPQPTPPPATEPVIVAAPEPEKPSNPEGAMAYYRKGLAAFRSKDYYKAYEELKSAHELDPSNTRIYMAMKRAEQQIQSGGSQ